VVVFALHRTWCSAIGREWMAIRDMDVVAAVIGIRHVRQAHGVCCELFHHRCRWWSVGFCAIWLLEPAALIDRCGSRSSCFHGDHRRHNIM
jgi:hypothetical protein